jgi:hypothetical protein
VSRRLRHRSLADIKHAIVLVANDDKPFGWHRVLSELNVKAGTTRQLLLREFWAKHHPSFSAKQRGLVKLPSPRTILLRGLELF